MLSIEVSRRHKNLQSLHQIRIRLPLQQVHAPRSSPSQLLTRNLHRRAIRQAGDTLAARHQKITRIRIGLLFLDQLILMLNPMPIHPLDIPQPPRHHQIISRNDRVLRHVLAHIRPCVRVRYHAVLIKRRSPFVRGRERAVAVAVQVERVAHFVHDYRQAAPVVVVLVLLIEEHELVVGVVGVVGHVVGKHEHAFDVGAGTDGDAAEELNGVPEGVRAILVAAKDLIVR